MTGDPANTCQRNGQWTGEEVTCSSKSVQLIVESSCSHSRLIAGSLFSYCWSFVESLWDHY